MTFNMMISQRVHPKISTYTEIHGAFSFTNTPLAPICIKELVHENSNVRLSWATHGMDGYYLGPDMEHNRCYQVYTHQKRGKRVVDIVESPPRDIPIPVTSSTDMKIKAAEDLVTALSNQAPPAPLHVWR